MRFIIKKRQKASVVEMLNEIKKVVKVIRGVIKDGDIYLVEIFFDAYISNCGETSKTLLDVFSDEKRGSFVGLEKGKEDSGYNEKVDKKFAKNQRILASPSHLEVRWV